MRVLHLVNWMNNSGNGITNVAVDLSWAQVDAGDSVHVATLGGAFLPMLTSHGVMAHELDMTSRTPRGVASAMRKLKALERQVKPDVIHAHVLVGTVMARVATHTPVVSTVHNEWQRGAVLMGAAHQVVGVSDAVTAAMKRRGVSSERLSTVLNGVVGSPRRDLATSQDVDDSLPPGRAIMTLGAVSRRKGSDVLFEAFARVAAQLPDTRLYYIGNPDWQDFVREVQRGDLADRVTFVGYRDDPRPLLSHADLFVLPSRRDPYPLALLEAMEWGLPIIGSRVDGIPEALGYGECGLLSPVEDVEALAEQMLKLLRDESLATALADRAQVRSREFTISAMAQNYRQIYERALTC